MGEQHESTYADRYRQRLIDNVLGITKYGRVMLAHPEEAIRLIDNDLDARRARAAASQENLRQRLATEVGLVALSEA